MPRTQGTDEYLEAIYVLETEEHSVIASRLADYLSVARPTVSQTMQRMAAAGLVTAGQSREILLTESGRQRAELILRRHRLLERWLTDELGLDWADAHVEAARLEYAISPTVEDRLYERLGRPTTCPHGNVIPGANFTQPRGVPLTEIESPADVRVLRIVEQAEEDLELLRFLHQSGLVPGARVSLQAPSSPYEAGISVVVGDKHMALDVAVASRIMTVQA